MVGYPAFIQYPGWRSVDELLLGQYVPETLPETGSGNVPVYHPGFAVIPSRRSGRPRQSREIDGIGPTGDGVEEHHISGMACAREPGRSLGSDNRQARLVTSPGRTVAGQMWPAPKRPRLELGGESAKWG